jgi:Integrase core domain.
MAKENPSWGYDRIVGALANLGPAVDQTVGNILRRHGLSPAPKRKQAISWKDFIRSHMEVLVGTDFFTVEVLTLKGLVTYYVLFFIHLESRRVSLAGMTPYPGQEWMEQQARNATMEEWGFLRGCRYLLHDRDTKFCASFRELIESGSVETIRLPARSPNLNSFAERWVRSVKEECLSKLILFGERSLAASVAAICGALQVRFILPHLAMWLKTECTLFRSWYCGVSIAASDTCAELCCSLCFYCASIKNPRAVVQGMLCFYLTSFDRQPKCSGIHA